MEDIFKDDISETLKGELCDWVMARCNSWRDHYASNYAQTHDEYYRLYRNQWSAEDKERQSERSKLIAPALAQAVESNVAEVEEATFGRGKLFGIKDDMMDQDPKDVAYLERRLHEDFATARIRSGVAECLVNAAVYGTGIAEVILTEMKVYNP
jgi:hypothetical protein